VPTPLLSNTDSLWILQTLSSVECSAGQSSHPDYIPVAQKSPPAVGSDDEVLEWAAALDLLDDAPPGLHAFMNTIVPFSTTEPASAAGPGVVAQSVAPVLQGKQRFCTCNSNKYGHPFHMTIAAVPYQQPLQHCYSGPTCIYAGRPESSLLKPGGCT
jgi:hypothetical protein